MECLTVKRWDSTESYDMEGYSHSMLHKNSAVNVSAYPLFHGLVQVMLSMVETRDAYTAAHQRNVSNLACMIAEQMGFSAMRIAGLHFAALIHDVGKISIPSEILHKPTMLTELEFKFIKMHCITGSHIIQNIDTPWPLARIILEHHERLDGSGYPYGIKGDAILLESQVLSVADVVDAIIMHRPYRPGMGMDAAISEIENHKNTAFNGDVVEVCTKILKNNWKYSLGIAAGIPGNSLPG